MIHDKLHYGIILLATFLVNLDTSSGVETIVVCYYGSWAVYRPGDGSFDVEDIDPFVCTHLIYGFAGLDPVTHQIYSLDPWNDLEDNWGKGAYKRFNALREVNPSLKTILAIGGWNEGSEKYSTMSDNSESRKIFVDSVVIFLETYGFTGFDLDWEYPAQRGGLPEDKVNYILLLKELKEALSPHGYSLSAAVSAGKESIDSSYDVPQMVKYLDHIHIMEYDFHGSWESFVGMNSPLYQRPADTLENQMLTVNYSVNYWLSLGAPAEKLVLGMATYGRSFTLANIYQHNVYDPSSGPGIEGPYTREAGSLGYNEICQNFNSGGWTTVFEDYYESPYMYSSNQWVSYDDEDSIRIKSNYAKNLGLGGGMVWSIETDDFHGYCGRGRYPLLRVINEVLRGEANTTAMPDTTVTATQTTTKATTQPPTTARDVTTSTSVVSSTPFLQSTTTTPVTGAPTTPFDINDYVKAHCEQRFVRDPNDCSKYYECVMSGAEYLIYDFSCGDGLEFNTDYYVCDWPQNVDC